MLIRTLTAGDGVSIFFRAAGSQHTQGNAPRHAGAPVSRRSKWFAAARNLEQPGRAEINSRERVRAALEHREPDRVPIDLGGMGSTGIAALAYHELKEYLGLRGGEVRVHDVAQMLALVEKPVRERFGVDVLPLPHYDAGWGWGVRLDTGYRPWRQEGWPDLMMPGSLRTGYDELGNQYILNPEGRRVAVRPNGGQYFDPLPVKPSPLPRPENLGLKSSLTDQELRYYETTARGLYENTDCAVLGASLGYGLFTLDAGGLDNWLCAMLTQTDDVAAILDRAVECNIPILEQYNQAAGKYVEAVLFSDDLGTQNGEWISPDLFRELFVPPYKRLFGWIHGNTNLKVFFHSCGSIPNLIGDLIDCGMDILNPVQTTAKGMDPLWLKQTFGDRLVFWGGGVDTQHMLPFASTGELAADVKKRLAIFAPGGGYVFNPIHNIQAGTPPEKIVAIYDAARDFGQYPVISSRRP